MDHRGRPRGGPRGRPRAGRTCPRTYEKIARQERDLRESLQSETAALNAATQAHAKAFAEHANHLLEIASLRVHVKANILFYMQAIWSHTFRDQIFFSLHKLKAPALRPRQKTYAVNLPAEAPAHVVPRPAITLLEVHVSVSMEPPVDPEQDFVTLAEVADLDHPLGFKGNYMVFPLKRSNALTDFMMVPYVDSELGLHDPDQLGNWDPVEFVNYVRSLKKTLSAAEFEAIKPQLAEQYRRILTAPRRAQEEIVVPTTSLYIEALPGAHPNLEDFKLKHRAMDVQRVAEEVRKLKLESLRYTARILSGEREDPDVDRKIVIDGNGDTIVVPPLEDLKVVAKSSEHRPIARRQAIGFRCQGKGHQQPADARPPRMSLAQQLMTGVASDFREALSDKTKRQREALPLSLLQMVA